MENVQYQPLDTIPDAAHRMKPSQTKQDMALKRLQYLISGIFRPLDILGHEISLDNENANIQRYLTILADCRTLLLNLSSQVNDMRNTLGFQTINPTFKSTAAPTQKFYDASCRFSSSPSNSPDTLFLYSYAPLKLLSVLQFNVGSAKLLEYPQQNHVFLSDDVVTMGNWSSSAVFENHYCREHLSQFDFSNTLIDIDDASDEDDDQFFDAEDNMTCD
ncbi:hypothetical protein CU097_002700 [Rhizopus azygosporus]|uniref:Uncharacterized protein n=1 Tax=Rhizopus azygosporus TaxID=86630 RepID=A0A367JDJ0_RHIAZ|nr:hypothetical protein CU097_002700 [Rhizopus azygosporus]